MANLFGHRLEAARKMAGMSLETLAAALAKKEVVSVVPSTIQPKSKKEVKMGKNQHVVPHDGKWAVRGAGNTKVTSTHSTQSDAIDAARDIAQNQQSEVVIHRPDGRIRDKDSYGNDPCPPRDIKH